jgi:hypothetical protein
MQNLQQVASLTWLRVEDEIHLTKDFQGLITRLYPAVAPEVGGSVCVKQSVAKN